MKMWKTTYVDLDGNVKQHQFNSETHTWAFEYSRQFCARFGFEYLCTVEVG